jgi:Leu/Phe-tRNA-protein transferase
MKTAHLLSMGAEEISRERFEGLLERLINAQDCA